MKRKIRGLLVLVILVVSVLAAGQLFADDNPGMPSEGDVGRIRQKIEAYRIWKLTEELNLDQKTASRLFPLIHETDGKRQKVQAENRRLARLLGVELKNETPDSEKVNDFLNRLQANNRDLHRIEDEHLEKVRSILSPEDSARYIYFELKFKEQVQKMVGQSKERSTDRDNRDPQRDFGPGGAGANRGR